MKFRCVYEYSNPCGNPQHVWSVVGARGGIHLHITDLGETNDPRYSAGLEVHSRTPFPYDPDAAPSFDQCWLLKAPCWSTGTSQYAQEAYVPRFELAPHDHEAMWRHLQYEYKERLEPKETEEER